MAIKYTIPAKTKVSIAKDDDHRAWHGYITSHENCFDSFRTFDGNAYTFERDGWLLLVRRGFVLIAR